MMRDIHHVTVNTKGPRLLICQSLHLFHMDKCATHVIHMCAAILAFTHVLVQSS